MADIKPFKGIRYNPSAVNNIGDVITPPYDVINPAEQELLHKINPYNIIRVEFGIINPGDTETDNRYSRAAEIIHQWLQDNIIKVDQVRNYYLYEQQFSYNDVRLNRRGIMAAVKLEPYCAKVILPHEKTMSGPKQDRLNLLRHSRTNISPIFTLFPDPEKMMGNFFDNVDYSNPDLEITEGSGTTHRIWQVSSPVLQDRITAYLAPQPLLIADGHHRYETALHYFQESDQDAMPGAGYILSTLVSMNDPGLLLLPTHRLLSGITNTQKEYLSRLIKDNFNVNELCDPSLLNRNTYLKNLEKVIIRNGLGFISKSQACIITPKNPNEKLPVSLLHDHLLNPLFDLKDDSQTTENILDFTHDFDSAIEAVIEGTSDAAFILNTIPVEVVLDYAFKGKIMPQKSTYFYPKLPSGLVIHHIDLSY